MRYSLYIILIVASVLTACHKDKSPAPGSEELAPAAQTTTGTQTTTATQSDSIYYVDIQDVTIKSIFSYTTLQGNCTVGLPKDTQVVASFDLDGDLVNDISFSCNNIYHFQSASVPCVNYQNTIMAGTSNISTVDSILVLPAPAYTWCDSLSLNKVIGPGKRFYPYDAPVYLATQSFNYSFGLNKDTYIGIVLRRHNVTMYGWLLVSLGVDNSITFKSYALNLKNSKPIAAGQTQ